MSSMHLSSHRLWERINQNACIIKLIINEYPNNLSFDLLGFDPTVCLSLTQETALHRCILYLHYSKITCLSYKTKIMIHLLKDCLHLQDEALQTLLHTAAIKLGSGNMADYHFTQRQAWFPNSGTSMIRPHPPPPKKKKELMWYFNFYGSFCVNLMISLETCMQEERFVLFPFKHKMQEFF